MADVVPAAIELLDPELRTRLAIVQQARAEDLDRVRSGYGKLTLPFEVAPFFSDLPARIAASHLIIARSGASTVAELSVIGRPAILVPLPHALDQDQFANAAHLAAAGAAIVVTQKDFTSQWLAATLDEARHDPASLARRADAARRAGVADAAEKLADLVIAIARGEDKQ